MALSHILLGLLAGQPMHGYDLKTAFDKEFGVLWNLNFGQVYPTLDKLSEQGFLSTRSESYGGRERNVYSITDAGKEELIRWLQSPSEPIRIGREETFLKLAVASWTDTAYLREIVQERRHAYRHALADFVRLQASLDQESDLYAGMVLDAMILRTEAELKWLERVESRLEHWKTGRSQDDSV